MTVATMTQATTGFGKAIVKTLLAIWIGFIAFGESAGRARAASELHRLGYVEEARRLMLDEKL
jgi:hypothetical protein